jgi:hypothetical protein
MNQNPKRRTVKKRRQNALEIKEKQVHHLNKDIMEEEEDSNIS